METTVRHAAGRRRWVGRDLSTEPSRHLGGNGGNPRNSVSVGNGIYKSIDGGQTWSHLGLDRTERIHRILLHPGDPNVAYVAAMGQMWGENPERGVYKTTDGGKTWRKVLSVDDKTGCGELVMDPANPNKLIAAMWEYRRWPWFFKSGGPGSGLYKYVRWRRNLETAGLRRRVAKGRTGANRHRHRKIES